MKSEYYNDDHGILKAFNEACGLIAENFEIYIHHARHQDVDIVMITPENISIPDIDEWWQIQDKNNKTFFQLHQESLERQSGQDHQKIKLFLETNSGLMTDTNMHDDFKQKTNEKFAGLIRYTPHSIDYAFPTLLPLGGLKNLSDICAKHQLALDIMLLPNQDKNNINDNDAYITTFIIRTNDKTPVKSKVALPKRRLN